VGRPKQHGEQTRAALLAAAAQLLHTEGRQAVSVRRVADAVDTTTRAVYSLFGDKDGLLRALSFDVAETMRRYHEQIPVRDDPVAELIELAFAYRRAALDKPNLYAVFIDEVRGDANVDDPVFALVYRSFERVLTTIRRCLTEGRFTGRTEFDIGRGLLALVHGLASLELRGVLGDDAAGRQVWRSSVEAMLAGFQTPPPKPVRRRGGSEQRHRP
jgi:AcrR family transcriptional regulator